MNVDMRDKIDAVTSKAPTILGRTIAPCLNKKMKHEPARTSYGRSGSLEVSLATRKKEIKKAQQLRYKVFYKEMSAIPDTNSKLKRRDIDHYDKYCDHLILIDHNASLKDKVKGEKPLFIPKKPKVVGTYRMLREDVAKEHGGFYTENEYDIKELLARKSNTHKFLEVGRSCVLKTHRGKRSIEMLWQGLWTYICANKINVMIGCASFTGINPREHALALSYLHHFHRAPKDWSARAHSNTYVDMNLMPKSDIDMKRALKAMPPLIKGYLRLGAFFADGAVIDRQFGTTDIMVILPVEVISQRYLTHFGKPDKQISRLEQAAIPAFN